MITDVITSFTLYLLIPKFGTIFTKSLSKLLTSFPSDVRTVDFSIRGIVFYVLNLFLNTGFTVSYNFFDSVNYIN